MLDVKQQKVLQENLSLSKSDITDFTALEVSMTYTFFKLADSKLRLYSKHIDAFCLLII